MSYKISRQGLWLIIVTTCIFLGNNAIQVVLGTIMAIYTITRKRAQSGLCYKDCFIMFKWFFLPYVFIHIYTILLIIFDISDISILSTNLLTYIPILLSIAIVHAYGLSGCIYTFVGLALAWLVEAIKVVSNKGVGIIFESFYQVLFVHNFSYGSFEMDDMTLALGYFLILYLALRLADRKKSLMLAVFFTIAFVLGVKRIAILASLIVVFVNFVLSKAKEKKRYKISLIVGMAITLFGIAFIFLLGSDKLLNLIMYKYNVNLMSRNYFWNGILDETRFALDFFGYGRGSVLQMMYSKFPPYQHVHSDYIKMFTEIGLIPYILWLIYYTFLLIKKIKTKYGYDAAYVAFISMIYTFILFLTDNTDSYFICGLMRSIIPMAFIAHYKYGGNNIMGVFNKETINE